MWVNNAPRAIPNISIPSNNRTSELTIDVIANVTPFLESRARGDKGWLQIRSKETTRLRQDGSQGSKRKWQVKSIAGLRPLCAEEPTPNSRFLSTNIESNVPPRSGESMPHVPFLGARKIVLS